MGPGESTEGKGSLVNTKGLCCVVFYDCTPIASFELVESISDHLSQHDKEVLFLSKWIKNNACQAYDKQLLSAKIVDIAIRGFYQKQYQDEDSVNDVWSLEDILRNAG